MEKSIVLVSVINRQIVPTMTKMIDSLDQFIQLDVPFLLDERTKRVDTLKEIMQEKMSQLLKSSERLLRLIK